MSWGKLKGCFSQQWKAGKKKVKVDMFRSVQVFKEKGMKIGTWGISGKIKRSKVKLKLTLIIQKGVYRAVPQITLKNKPILSVCPGKVEKEKMVDELIFKLDDRKIKRSEIFSALPAGGYKIC